MEAIKTISNMEMKLQHITEENSFNRNQLDTASTKLDQVMAIIDNHIQNLDDTFVKTHDPKTKETAYRTVLAMRNLREDISKVVEREE